MPLVNLLTSAALRLPQGPYSFGRRRGGWQAVQGTVCKTERAHGALKRAAGAHRIAQRAWRDSYSRGQRRSACTCPRLTSRGTARRPGQTTFPVGVVSALAWFLPPRARARRRRLTHATRVGEKLFAPVSGCPAHCVAPP
jgi:hypothetical protein